MPAQTCVYRAPMRSPRADVDLEATIDRAKALGLCGFGGATSADHRLARRIARFAEVDDGSFVWTRDAMGCTGWAASTDSTSTTPTTRQSQLISFMSGPPGGCPNH